MFSSVTFLRSVLLLGSFLAVSSTFAPLAAEARTPDKYEKSGECTIANDLNADNVYETIVGRFDIIKVVSSADPANVGYEQGSHFASSFNAASQQYAAKTAAVQLSVERDPGQSYLLTAWGMTPGRVSEARVEVRFEKLPFKVVLNLGPLQLGKAQEVMGRAEYSCVPVAK